MIHQGELPSQITQVVIGGLGVIPVVGTYISAAAGTHLAHTDLCRQQQRQLQASPESIAGIQHNQRRPA
jgi:hypothetical protein